MICAIVIISRIADACSASSAPKSTLERLHRVQRRIHRAEQHAPMRRILRCIGDAKPLAHRVVDLRRVEPHMRVGQRQPMRHQPGPRDAQRLPRIVIGRRGKRLLEQRQQRKRRRQRGLAPPHQRLRECSDARRFGRVRTEIELLAHRIQRRGDACGERFGRRQCGNLCMHTRKLPPLHLQSQPQRVPPADIGAAVGVVADPARQDHRTRIEFRPAIRPGAARDGQQCRVELVDRIAAMLDGSDSLRKLVRQRDRRRAMRSRNRGRPPARRLRQCLLRPEPEARMSDAR